MTLAEPRSISAKAARVTSAGKSRSSPRQSYRETFDLSKFDGGGIRATIQTDGDALATDDIAYTYLPLKKKTKVHAGNEGQYVPSDGV